MKVVLQVVNRANVVIEGKVYNEIKKGYLLFVGIGKDDNEDIVKSMAKKISKLRVFKDSNGKTNLDIQAVKGEILSISQFTLYASTGGGNRPDFLLAAGKEQAIRLYELFNEELKKFDLIVKPGIFGADMKINLENDGPFTLIMEM